MKTAKQIKALRKRTKEYQDVMAEILSKGGQDNSDQALANLQGTPGWGIVENFFEALICQLLVPVPFDGDANDYVIESQSRLATINAVEAIMKSVKSAAQGMEAVKKAENQPSGKSE